MVNVHDERKLNVFFLKTMILCALLLGSTTEVGAQEISGTISRVGDSTHLEFRGRKNWSYANPVKENNKITLITPAFNDVTLVQLQTWSCPLIKKIEVNKAAPDGQYEVTISLNSNDVESFDYLTDDPSHLIFDFYMQADNKSKVPLATSPEAPNVKKIAKKKIVKSKIAKLPEKRTVASGDYEKLDRKPAGSETLQVAVADLVGGVTALDSEERYRRGVFDGGDPEFNRFKIKDYQVKEDAIIASQQNIYIKFPPMTQKLTEFTKMMKSTPEYEIQTDGSEESKVAKLIVTLYNKNRLGALFETFKYFDKKFKNSRYDEIMKNVKAEAHIKLYQRDGQAADYDSFRSIYRYLVETYPDSELTERNHLLLAYSSLESKDGAETLRDLKRYLDKYPNSLEKDRIRMAMSESYGLLHKYKDAIRVYEDIIASPIEKQSAIEAAFRIGDVYIASQDYKAALETYTKVQAQYPAFIASYPNAQYNLSESQFWLKNYKESLDGYISFLKIFPSDKYCGFAQTRIGELLEILGADQQQVMGAFVEGYFRFPESQGSEVARIRMLSRGLAGMKEREKKRALTEIDEITSKSTLPGIIEFATLMKSDGLSLRSQHTDALNILVQYYQNNPTTANLEVFKGRILRNISDVLKSQTEKNKAIEALNFYGKYSTNWLKNSSRIDVPYFQGVAYEQAGVGSQAKVIYEQTAKHLKSIVGKKEEHERRVYENLPSLDQVNLRLAAVSLQDKDYQASYKYMSAIKSKMSNAEEIEKVQIGAVVSEQTGDTKGAIRYLEKLIASYEGNLDMIVRPELDLARLYIKLGQFEAAEGPLANVEKNHETNSNMKDEDWSRALELRAELLYQNGQKLAAVEAYTKLLDAYESKYPLSTVRYKAGKILFDEGDLRGAEKIWSSLSETTGGFYKKLALEKLSQAEWQDTYKKYIDRIPAAQDLK